MTDERKRKIIEDHAKAIGLFKEPDALESFVKVFWNLDDGTLEEMDEVQKKYLRGEI